MTIQHRRKKPRRRPLPPRVRCDYCGAPATLLRDSSLVYNGLNYGPVWFCANGHEASWVGCHPNTDKPLGRLADKELRKAKMAVHGCFDWMYKLRIEQGVKKHVARAKAYEWLADQMKIDRSECHVGMFNLDRCRLAMEVLAPYQHLKGQLLKASAEKKLNPGAKTA